MLHISSIPDPFKILPAIEDLATGDTSKEKAWETIGREGAKPIFYLLPPFGGGQAKKIAESALNIAQGGSYTHDSEGNRRLRYPVENPNLLEVAQMMAFGQYSSPSAQEYVAGGFKTYSARKTTAYENALRSGVSGDAFRQWWDTQAAIGPIKDEEGNIIKGVKNQVIEAVQDMDVTPTQRVTLLEGAIKDFDKEIATARDAGVSDEVLLDWWAMKDNVTPDKDDDGKTIASKKSKLLEAVQGYDIPSEQKMALLESADKSFAEQMEPAVVAGIDTDTIMKWWSVKENLAPVRDAEGKVEVSKLTQALEAVQNQSASAAQKLVLMNAAGYDVDEYMPQARAAGVGDDVLLDWWQKKETIEPDYSNTTGEAIDRTQGAKVMQAALDYGVGADQTLALLEDGMKKSSYEKLSENLAASRAAGIRDEVALQWWAREGLVRGEVNAYGRSIAYSRQRNLVPVVQELPLTGAQKYLLLEQAGVNMAKLELCY